MGNFSCFQELVRQKAVASWYDLQKWHIDPDSGQGGAIFIDVFPRKLTCPLESDRFKRRCHLPTIDLQRPYEFLGGAFKYF